MLYAIVKGVCSVTPYNAIRICWFGNACWQTIPPIASSGLLLSTCYLVSLMIIWIITASSETMYILCDGSDVIWCYLHIAYPVKNQASISPKHICVVLICVNVMASCTSHLARVGGWHWPLHRNTYAINLYSALPWRDNEWDGRWPVNSPHKRPVTRKMFPFDDVIMGSTSLTDTLTRDHARYTRLIPDITLLTAIGVWVNNYMHDFQ